MGIKVGHVSISEIIDKYSNKRIKDLDANPPAEILREQESLEKYKDDFEKLYIEQQEAEETLYNQIPDAGYRAYYFKNGKLFRDAYPELVGLMKSSGRPDPAAFVYAVDNRNHFWFYSENEYNNRDWGLSDAELESIDYRYESGMAIMALLYQRAKIYVEKIKQDEQDIKDLKARYSQNIKTEADKKVREAMQALATEESYDLIYDPSEVAIVALNSTDVSDKISAKVV